YHPLYAALHWLMFILFVVALATIEYRDDIPKGDPLRDLLRTVHMHAGQLVLIFVVVRLIARKLLGVPPELPLPRLQQLGA
ncbi:cytochrome b, partial [Salmonella enterica]|uniref:cytochrome b n=2 Tax=Pseudomonadota TaxID=1224 RepID=UPI003CE88CD8